MHFASLEGKSGGRRKKNHIISFYSLLLNFSFTFGVRCKTELRVTHRMEGGSVTTEYLATVACK